MFTIPHISHHDFHLIMYDVKIRKCGDSRRRTRWWMSHRNGRAQDRGVYPRPPFIDPHRTTLKKEQGE